MRNQQRRLFEANTSYGTMVPPTTDGNAEEEVMARIYRDRDDDLHHHNDTKTSVLPIPSSSSELQSAIDVAPQSPSSPTSSQGSHLRRQTTLSSSLLRIFLVVSCVGLSSFFLYQEHHWGNPVGNDITVTTSMTSPTSSMNGNDNILSSLSSTPPPPSSFYSFLFDNIGSLLWRGSSSTSTTASLGAASPDGGSGVTRSILLVLNGDAVPEDPYLADDQRPLTSKGIQDSERLGMYLSKHNIPPPDWIFSSPSVRTSYTLELIRRHWASDVPVAYENILYILEFNDYFAFCAGLNFNFRRVLIVGHNPAILNTAKKLMATHGIEDFPHGGLMEITWDDQPIWRDLVPFTGRTTLALSPTSKSWRLHINVTVLSGGGDEDDAWQG